MIRRALLASAFALAFSGAALAQQPGQLGNSPTGSGIIGNGAHAIANAPGIPVCTGCTLADGSNDISGQFTGSATSGSLVFQFPYVRPPFCSLDSQTVTGAAWNATNQGITLTTIVNGTTYTYTCFARPGG